MAEPPAGTITAATAVTDATTHEGYTDDEGEEENMLDGEEVQQPPPGHPGQDNYNARPPPRPVCDNDHVAKLKLNLPPFEGRYNPDAYRTWELEVEKHFSCL
jgi:hypothetical protein